MVLSDNANRFQFCSDLNLSRYAEAPTADQSSGSFQVEIW
jgi:hypothetical protein